jgi:hypothetical protein
MTTATQTNTRTTVNIQKLLTAAAIAGGVGALINLVIFFVLPAVFNVSLRIPLMGTGSELVELPFFMVIMASIVPAFGGAGVFWVLSKFTAQPVRIFRIIAIVFGGFSLIMPFSMGIGVTQTIILDLMHIVVAVSVTYFITTRGK